MHTEERVRAVVDELVESGAESGVQVAVYRRGELVADVAAGPAMAPGTLVYVASAAKGVAATVVHVLAERGVLGYDTRIADVWPEFGVHGKERATVRHALTHAVGVPALPAGLAPADLGDWPRMCALVAGARPRWEPGTRTGYHAFTYGWIVGETVRRATGEPISQLLRDEVAGPLGVADELYFGVPPAQLGRVATLDGPPGGSDPLAPSAAYGNRREVLVADIPAGGTMSARALARMYAALLGPVDGVRLVPASRLAELSTVAFAGVDAVLGNPVHWGLGYSIGRLGARPADTPTVFGMAGAGGAAGYADRATGTAVAVTRSRFVAGDFRLAQRVSDLILST